MQGMTVFCCTEYWAPYWVADCQTQQLAYWLWLPERLAHGHNFMNLNNYFAQLYAHINAFDPQQEGNLRVRAHMCNCGYHNNDPTECTHQLQATGHHPHTPHQQVAITQRYPHFSWPTTNGNTHIYVTTARCLC